MRFTRSHVVGMIDMCAVKPAIDIECRDVEFDGDPHMASDVFFDRLGDQCFKVEVFLGKKDMFEYVAGGLRTSRLARRFEALVFLTKIGC